MHVRPLSLCLVLLFAPSAVWAQPVETPPPDTPPPDPPPPADPPPADTPPADATAPLVVQPPATAPEPPLDEPTKVPFALSVGTGPVPINTLTLGLTGLAGRAMFPGEFVAPFVGVGVNTATLSSFDAGERTERSVDGVTALSVNGGVRAELIERTESVAIPYVVAGAMFANVSARSGEPGDVERVSETVVGAFGSLGLDGFVTSQLSIGAEIGLLGSFAFGSDESGDFRNDIIVVSATTGLFVTVWL